MEVGGGTNAIRGFESRPIRQLFIINDLRGSALFRNPKVITVVMIAHFPRRGYVHFGQCFRAEPVRMVYYRI
jgi:hypothetical protein